jgi:hypothetical protein
MFFVDVDGTLVTHGTNEPIRNERGEPENILNLKRMLSYGHQVVLVTRRGAEFPGNHCYGTKSVVDLLAMFRDKFEIDTSKIQVITDASSPRVVINDEGAFAWTPETNTTWDFNPMRFPGAFQ